MKKYILLLVIIILSLNGFSQSIDWPQFMAKQDLIWSSTPHIWYESPFMGNGTHGLMIYMPKDSNYVKLDIGNALVQDHRDDSYGISTYSRCRLPIGEFQIIPTGKILKSNFRLDLWNAETTGIVETDQGSIKIRAYVHAIQQLIVVEFEPSEGEKNTQLNWQPAQAISPRQTFGRTHNMPARVMKNYIENPAGHLSINNQTSLYTQPLLVGGETATAWQQITKGNKHSVFINISHSFPKNTAHTEAVTEVGKYSKLPIEVLNKSHQNWWHSFYPKSFVSLPDKKIENFYWIQLYKLASATRSDGTLIDNQGPWLQETPWPQAWWNLNVQLTYWLSNGSNHADFNNSLLNTLIKNKEQLIQNVEPAYREDAMGIGRATGNDLNSKVKEPFAERIPSDNNNISVPTPEIGLLPWTCHNLWLQYRYTMDDVMLREKLFPILRKSINYYLHFLTKETDGKYHLPYTYSPEYGIAKDCNFDLSLLKWGCQALIQCSERLKINDPLMTKWQDVVTNLVDFPTDENGLRIGADQPYDKSHRHYSHLLMIYPLYMINIDQQNATPLIEKSLAYWHSKPGALQGYSFTGAASISAALGKGDDALKYLNGLFSKFLKPNTLYAEDGPVIETPLSGGQAILDMLLQSWGDKIRIFPSVPSAWKDLNFKNLCAEGAFLVSAKRVNARTVYINIKSEKGEPCILKTDMENPVLQGELTNKITKITDNTYKIILKKGESVSLIPKNEKIINTSILPISFKENEGNYFGLK